MKKICTGCKLEKELSDFGKCKSFKDGYQYRCKSCFNKSYKENREEILNKLKENPEVLVKKKKYREENQEKIKSYSKKWREENSEHIKNYSKEYKSKNSESIKEYQSKYMEGYYSVYYEENKEKISEKHRKYRNENREKYNETQRKILKNRRDNDPLYKLRKNLSSLISHSIKRNGYTKKSKAFEILGCDFESFRIFIESKFVEGMNWNNYGEWHLDHIFPVSLALDEAHMIELNHYTNFQPLWARDNISKSNKIIEK